MIAALHIDLRGESFYSFEVALLNQLKARLPEIVTFDMDASSDPSLLEYASKLLQESTRSIIFIIATKDVLPRVFALLEEVHRNHQKYLVFLEGENPWIEKMFADLPENYPLKNLPAAEVLSAAEAFLKTLP